MLLRAMDSETLDLNDLEKQALKQYITKHRDSLPDDWNSQVVQWARLRLPNGQVARSAWKEDPKGMKNVRIAKMVKVYGIYLVGLSDLLIILKYSCLN